MTLRSNEYNQIVTWTAFAILAIFCLEGLVVTHIIAIFINYFWNVDWQNLVSAGNAVEKQLSRCSLLKWQPCFPLCITSVHSNSRITSNPNLALPQTSGQGFWLKGFWLIPSYLQQNKSLVIRKYMCRSQADISLYKNWSINKTLYKEIKRKLVIKPVCIYHGYLYSHNKWDQGYRG